MKLAYYKNKLRTFESNIKYEQPRLSQILLILIKNVQCLQIGKEIVKTQRDKIFTDK